MAAVATNPTVIALCLLIAAASSVAAAYANYTVGGNASWFFDEATNATSANYSAWLLPIPSTSVTYLLFNTNTNQTVIHTYNLTTYQTCSTDDVSDLPLHFLIKGGMEENI